MELNIDIDFKNWITPLTKEEYKQLETNIIQDGCREPIVVWNDTILDGHNRYSICKWNDIPFTTVTKEFDSHQDALNWIIDNQLGRRNLAPWQMSVLRGKRYNAVKQEHGGDKIRMYQNDTYENTREKVAQQFGVSPATIQRDGEFAKVAEIVAKEVDLPIMQLTKPQIMEAAKKIQLERRDQVRAEKYEKLKQAPQLPTGKYRIIYADPPWSYGNKMPDYVTTPDDYYPLMSTSDICELPIKDLAEDNAVLFLWTTSPHLEESFQVINAWGFKYKSSFIWDKVKHNMGHYNSVRHEFLLICTRGSCQPDIQKLFDSVITEERTEHSKKPETFRTIIDTIYPLGQRIELFAREKHEGWDNYGNETGL